MLFAIACATTLGGVVTAVWYWRLRRNALAALISLYAAEGEQVQPARERYWSLDKRAKYVALGNMACWVATVLGLGLLDQTAELIPWLWQRLFVVGGAALSMWAMVIIADIYNSRESEQRWKRW